ncbi:MAG: D-alanine--D-alanine ligase [Candidatus Paceibacterota bacterium]
MSRIRVGVLRGGPSSEYEVSIKSGGSVLRNLPTHFEGKDIFIDRSGVWHLNGLPRDVSEISQHVDVVFNALHGQYGEDGGVQRDLERHGIRYTGSKVFPSILGMNKRLSKEKFKEAGIKTPMVYYCSGGCSVDGVVRDVHQMSAPPYIVKPISAGSSVGVKKAHTIQELALIVGDVLDEWNEVMVEECILGKEATCGVIEDFRDTKHYSLLPVEIIPPKDNKFFDYHAKYSGVSREVCPGCFSDEEKEMIQHYARVAHDSIGARHYSRSDFMIHPKRGVFILELNTLPGLTEESLLPKSLTAIGSSMSHFLDHVIQSALYKS